ncbi:Cytokinin dehydrogenase 1, FAD and cytokinin binding [Lentzea albidocapillata subsp. violacea]|uniref:Cytokinin dehydrogenase 1, FAD and cytokinin binding n=1 Tax=Lentzea albidocapillata subsp. violacea TaxID=128104 RepID=A0A1G9RUT6_9PSEU|nr:FAD-binding protein [Lentzea albidocapillata]SDM26914.1 Cytokinin dehydrogenase 1, FAD and cytokinin binding [Lentzea albidocapillata subsp. violacea]
MAPAFAALPELAGTLDTDQDALRWAAHDYGGTVQHLPAAVLRPASAADISIVVRCAREHGLQVVPRGQGHSTSGQAQAPGGVVVDMNQLNRVHDVRPDRVVVDAGARWSDLLRATLPHGLTPPVLTDYLELTVGGTLSVGGLGGASHHHGAQTDNLLSLDVVTPSGDIVTCGPDDNREVFDAVRAGRGRSGIITRATLRLVPAPDTVTWHKLHYDTVDQLVARQRHLITTGAFDYVEGQLKLRDGQRVAELEAVTFTGVSAGHGRLDSLGFRDADTRTASYWDFVNRLADGEPLLRNAGLWESPHPWCNLLVPNTAAEELLRHNENDLGADLYSDFGLVLAYPLRTDRITTPRLMLPDDDIVFLVAALRYAPAGAPQVVAAMQAANDVLVTKTLQAGGRLYLDPLP